MVTKRKTSRAPKYKASGEVDAEKWRATIRELRRELDAELPEFPKKLRRNVPLPTPTAGRFVKYGSIAQRKRLAKALAEVAAALEACHAVYMTEAQP